MATYQGIKGRTVQNLASDPPASVGEGQIWYNTASDTLKVSVGLGAWASGTSLPTPMTRYSFPGFGTQDAGAIVGGYDTSGSPATPSQTNLYDGTSWTTGSTMPLYMGNQFNAQSGTQTAFYTTGVGSSPGSPPHTPQTTLELNGTTWSSTNPLSRSPVTYNGGAAGTQTAGLAFGGSATAYSESYDGDSWTATSALTTPTGSCSGSGTQTAAIMAGGYTSGYPTVCNTFNGSAWSTIDTLPSGRERAAACGQAGNMLLAGGSKDVTDVCDFTCVEYSDPTLKNVTTEAGRP